MRSKFSSKWLASVAGVALLASTLVVAQPASADPTDCVVTSSADSGAGTLRNCMLLAGTTGYEGGSNITFDAAVTQITLLSPIDIDVSEDLVAYMGFVITAPEAGVEVIQHASSFTTGATDRLIDISVLGSVTFWAENLKFKNSSNGAIKVSATNSAWVYAFDSEFSNNTTVAGSDYQDGPAIYVTATAIQYQGGGNTFSNNTSYRDGGAIYTNAPLNWFSDSYSAYSSNTAARDGGAIYVLGANAVTVEHGTFTSNSATRNGGAVYSNASTETQINWSTFTGNSAVLGGAVYQDGYFVSSRSSKFLNNTSTGNGGAIYSNGAQLYVATTHFDTNSSAASGGALFVSGDVTDLIVEQSSFFSNVATANGGAIATGVEPVLAAHNTFKSNSATGNGGGIYSPNASLAFNTFIDNTATNSGPDAYVTGISKIIGNIFANSTFGNTDTRLVTSTVYTRGGNYSTGIDTLLDSLNSDFNTVTFSTLGINLLVVEQFQSYYYSYEVSDWVAGDTTKGFSPADSSVVIGVVDPSAVTGYKDSDWNYPTTGDQALGNIFTDTLTAGAINVQVDGDGGDGDGGGDDSGDTPTDPINPNLNITKLSKTSVTGGGDSFVVYGVGLRKATELYIGSTKVNFTVQADGTLLVTTPVLALGQYDIRVVSPEGEAVLQKGLWVVDTLEFSTWTKHVGDTIKIYAKNVIGVGKVQLFVDGKEIAWVNAVDATDPKLRTANGFHYLVRTVKLKADGSKTRFEVKLNGERVRRNTYTINSN